MAKKLVTRPDGEVVYEIKRTHPFLGCLGQFLIISTLVAGPLELPRPWVYFLAPVIYVLEIIVLHVIWSTKKKNIEASERQEENYHGNSP